MKNALREKNNANSGDARRGLLVSLISFVLLSALLAPIVLFNRAQTVTAQQNQLQIQIEKAERAVADRNQNGSRAAAERNNLPAAARKLTGGRAQAKPAAAAAAPTPYYVSNVEFVSQQAREAFKMQNVTIFAATDRFADVFIASDAAYNAMYARIGKDIVWIEDATVATAPPPPPAKASPQGGKATPDQVVRGGLSGMTGKGVIVAVIDTGVDFRHPDFITYDATGKPVSRLLALWDTTLPLQTARGSQAPLKYPNGSSIGTLFTKDQLTAELRSAQPKIPATDLDGHGTACASIAAGNGNADKMTGGLQRPDTVGVAPDADIIAIKVDQGNPDDALENSYLLNAINEWLDKYAAARPLVVSCSFGGQYGGHDGQSIAERHLNARFPLTKPSRSIVISAGNQGDAPIHSQVNYGNKENAKLIAWNAPAGTLVEIYMDSAEDFYIAPGGQTQYSKPLFTYNPITKQLSAQFKTVSPGVGGIWLFNDSGTTREAHAYILGGEFLPSSTVLTHLIGNPGTAENAVTVGSYDWNDNFNKGGKLDFILSVCEQTPMQVGKISCYSSIGPTRMNGAKPEIVAPGQWFTAADAKNNGAKVGNWGDMDSTGKYRAMNGTSAAAPYTAGVIALMFQKKPTLTVGDVRQLLTKNVNTGDPFVKRSGAFPNKTWGYGKLDVPAVNRILAAIK